MDFEQLTTAIRELTERIEVLEEWRQAREKQQLTYPLDAQSQRIINDI